MFNFINDLTNVARIVSENVIMTKPSTQQGSKAVTTEHNTTKTVTVIFDTPFAEKPEVTATKNYTDGVLKITSVSKLSFTFTIQNGYYGQTVNYVITWKAVGVIYN